MKRLFSLLVVLAVSITTFAQIQTKIQGLILGKTTKNTAISIMKNKGYKLEYNDGTYICNKPISFGGVTWEGVEISFIENKVSSITFQITYTKEEKLNSLYSNLSGKLNKYSRYKGTSGTSNNGFDRSENYSDGIISINLKQSYLPSSLYLTYTYIKEIISQEGADEL